jgi:hypothetical protein
MRNVLLYVWIYSYQHTHIWNITVFFLSRVASTVQEGRTRLVSPSIAMSLTYGEAQGLVQDILDVIKDKILPYFILGQARCGCV